MGYRHEPKKADLFLKFLCLNSPNKLSTLLMWLPQPVFSVFLTLRLALSKKKMLVVCYVPNIIWKT